MNHLHAIRLDDDFHRNNISKTAAKKEERGKRCRGNKKV